MPEIIHVSKQTRLYTKIRKCEMSFFLTLSQHPIGERPPTRLVSASSLSLD